MVLSLYSLPGSSPHEGSEDYAVSQLHLNYKVAAMTSVRVCIFCFSTSSHWRQGHSTLCQVPKPSFHAEPTAFPQKLGKYSLLIDQQKWVFRNEKGSDFDRKYSQARALQAPLLRPEWINYSVQFMPKERQRQSPKVKEARFPTRSLAFVCCFQWLPK